MALDRFCNLDTCFFFHTECLALSLTFWLPSKQNNQDFVISNSVCFSLTNFMPKRKKKYLDFSSIQLRYLKCVMASVGRTYLTSMCIKEFGEWLLRVHTNWSKLQDQQLWNFRQIKSTDVGNVEKKEEVLFMEKNVHIFIGAFYIKESIKCGFVNQLHFVESFIQFRWKCGNIKKKNAFAFKAHDLLVYVNKTRFYFKFNRRKTQKSEIYETRRACHTVVWIMYSQVWFYINGTPFQSMTINKEWKHPMERNTKHGCSFKKIRAKCAYIYDSPVPPL